MLDLLGENRLETQVLLGVTWKLKIGSSLKVYLTLFYVTFTKMEPNPQNFVLSELPFVSAISLFITYLKELKSVSPNGICMIKRSCFSYSVNANGLVGDLPVSTNR